MQGGRKGAISLTLCEAPTRKTMPDHNTFFARTTKDETKRRHRVLLHDSPDSSEMGALTFFSDVVVM